MKLSFIVAMLCLALTGCGTTGQIKGRFVSADGRGIPDAEIVCWHRQLNPLDLPLRVAEAKTDESGRFEVYAKKRVTSISAKLWLPDKKVRHGAVSLFAGVGGEVVIKEEPNQSLEPTTLLGTSAAEQPLVPSRVVAHL